MVGILEHEAELKIFQIATVESRAIRRFQEIPQQITQVRRVIEERDRLIQLVNAPLRKAHDAIEVDITNMSINKLL